KSAEFYQQALQKHQLFAFVDESGQLRCEESGKPFFDTPTSFRETLFWRNLRKNNVHIHEDYPYVSRVNNDFVFVSSEDKPVVFHSYVNKTTTILRDESVTFDQEDRDVQSKHGILIYGNSIVIPFVPKYLSIHLETQNLYFPLMNTHIGGLGRLSPRVSAYFRPMMEKSDKSERSGYMFHFNRYEYDMESVDLKGIRA
ncbi:hypothetical protein WA577_007280, partial [Blastocystis sp. JDR]